MVVQSLIDAENFFIEENHFNSPPAEVDSSIYNSSSHDSIVSVRATLDIPEVSNLDINTLTNSNEVDRTYVLPPRKNRGVPVDRYSPEGKVKYAIANYISTDRLLLQHKAFVNQMEAIEIPSRVEEAWKDPKWVEAMNAEIEALQENETWDIVSKPFSKKLMGCRWVFTIKYKADGTIDRYKTRLAAKRYT